METIHKNYCSKCKEEGVPLIKQNVNKGKSTTTQYYYCRPCANAKYKDYYSRNKEKCRAIVYKSVDKHREKQNARMRVAYAVKSGKLIKPDSCPICKESDKRIEGHHTDYSNPLDVEWMCSGCHGDADRLHKD